MSFFSSNYAWRDEICVNFQPHSNALIKYLTFERKINMQDKRGGEKIQSCFRFFFSTKLTLRNLMQTRWKPSWELFSLPAGRVIYSNRRVVRRLGDYCSYSLEVHVEPVFPFTLLEILMNCFSIRKERKLQKRCRLHYSKLRAKYEKTLMCISKFHEI